MASSGTVSSGDLATAAQYNNLRTDVLDTSSGHVHDGTNGRNNAQFSLAVAGLPLISENTTDAVSNEVMRLRGDNATRADGDEIFVSFYLDDDGGNSHEFARITGDATDVSNGSEDGQIRFGVSAAGTMTDVFTIDSSTGGATSVAIKGGNGAAGVLYLMADRGDDAGDEWKVNIADGGVMTIGNDIASAGTHVTHLTITPNSTVANSSVTFAGNILIPDAGNIGSASDTDAIAITSGGIVGLSAGIDMLTNGNRIDFDADNDTSIRASGDDVLVIETAGADTFKLQWWQATLTGDYGTNINQYAYRDAAGVVSWHGYFARGTLASATVVQDDDALVDITAHGYDGSAHRRAASIGMAVDGSPSSSDMPGRIVFSTTADGAASVTERMRIDSTGNVLIGDTANGKTTTGLTINQGAADDEIFALKSSDIAHAFISGGFIAGETDTYLNILKKSATLGGARIGVFAEDAALTTVFEVSVAGGTAETTKSTSGVGLINFQATEHDGSNSIADLPSEGNVFSIRARVGGSTLTRLIVDEDGDLYSVTSAQTFDAYDDAQLVRALDQSKGSHVQSKWDSFVHYNEDSLIEAGILGAPVAEGGLVSVTALQRLHNGAIWQSWVRQQELEEKLAVMENRLLAIEGGR
jgi:hypothetical protein